MPDEEKNIGQPVTAEIATAEKDIDIFAGYIKRLENPDPVLRTEARGKGLKLYDEVDRDPHAGAVLQTRYLAVIGKEWEVLPAEETAGSNRRRGRRPTVSQNEKIAEFVQNAFKEINFDQARGELLQAILYGYYSLEVMWAVTDQGIVPTKLIGKHPRRFCFTPKRELRLITPDNMLEGEPVPPRKFIVFTYGDSDNPYGKGLGRKLWWPVWFKKNGVKFWLIFSEKFGSPTPVGKYPAGTPKTDQEKLLDAIKAIQTETGVTIPDTMVIELLEAQRTGSIDTYESFCDYMDRQISKATLGQTLTTEVKGQGSYAASDTHNDVREDILKADADLLCECLNNTLVRWTVDYNFPGVTAYPKMWIRVEAEQDLKELAERDKVLVEDIGVEVPKSYFYDTYALPRPEEGDETIGGRSNVPKPEDENEEEPAPQFAQGQSESDSPGDIPYELGAKALAEADMDALIGPVRKLLDEVETLDEFRERLLDLYLDMDQSDLGALMQRALTTAELAGRFDARER
jgi:phage gp29-like protein